MRNVTTVERYNTKKLMVLFARSNLCRPKEVIEGSLTRVRTKRRIYFLQNCNSS